jgi:hypothetical protein
LKKKSIAIVPTIGVLILVAIAVGIGYFFDTGDGRPYSSSSTGERGAGLLFDTLRHMGYGVRAGYRPLTAESSYDDVYILIQPRQPRIDIYVAQEINAWVRSGGRLVLLGHVSPGSMHYLVGNAPSRTTELFRIYQIGYGEVMFSGNAGMVTNYRLMNDSAPGEAIQTTISRWNAEREIGTVFFAEYYHGFHTPETFLGRLPLVFRLMLAQIIILAIAGVWHLGKRFGNPVPYYEEIEREENEYVRALARLYMATKTENMEEN